MRILINDRPENKERLLQVFINGGYEKNNLVFIHSFEEFKVFAENQLINNQSELDLIVTNNNNGEGYNSLQAQALLFRKNALDESFSNGNFRISSIPVILYSSSDDKSELQNLGYEAIVKSNEQYKHPYLISIVDQTIRTWRQRVLTDLDNIGIKPNQIPYFKNQTAHQFYNRQFGHNYLRTFVNQTTVLSKEFIANPTFLNYKWLHKNYSHEFEAQILSFGSMFRNHIKYGKQNNERTILHRFINDNLALLKRGAFSDTSYELPLSQLTGNERQVCDYLLKTDLPDYLCTTFFEVKKETVRLLAYKNRKHPKLNEEVTRHLEQLDDYQLYTEMKDHEPELEMKIGYQTNKYDFELLAGRLEEKEEYLDLFESKLKRRYKNIRVSTFEDFENTNYTYLEKTLALTPWH